MIAFALVLATFSEHMAIHSKLPTLGSSSFSQMSQLTAEQQAINLFQAFPAHLDADAFTLNN
ncbi:MAG: hypothetical protein CML20_16825 [Rheinheimera sp.]|nr:hypothetical protein [Rheinheimera sp.]|tara:strand:+ start:69293 stop:69478 length:186 start_codon:yes stop_codon:yes gene_type:complete